MKKTKKILSLLLSILMLASMMIPTVFAATDYSITVKNENTAISISGNTYYAYKLFDLKYSGTAYAYSIKTTNPFYSNASAKAIIEQYFTLSQSASNPTVYNATVKNGVTFDAATARTLADALQPYLPSTADGSKTVADGSEEAEIELTQAGYYIVTGTATAPEAQTITAAVALTSAKPEAEVNPKADAPAVVKTIVNADSANGKGSAQDVGSTVDFKVASTVPKMTGYTTYKYVVHDAMTTGLTFKADSVAVKINGSSIPASTATGIDTANDLYYVVNTSPSDSCTFEVEIMNMIKLPSTAAGQAIEVTYSATINENALISNKETNTASLQYSNNPYDSTSTGTTPGNTTTVYDFNIVIDKYTGTPATGETTTANKLSGAKFVLYKKVVEGGVTVTKYYHWDATNKKVVWYALAPAVEDDPLTPDVDESQEAETLEDAIAAGKVDEVETNASGAASFQGVDAGDYYLRETEAPTGYNPLTSDVKVEITATYNTDGTLASTSAVSVGNGQYNQTQSIQNSTGSVLPETGGIGTKIFYALGSLLALGAALMLITKKRLNVTK